MLPKYFTLIFTFYLILPESRDLPDFYCRASMVYNVMFLAWVFTRSFSSPLSKQNATGMRIQSHTE